MSRVGFKVCASVLLAVVAMTGGAAAQELDDVVLPGHRSVSLLSMPQVNLDYTIPELHLVSEQNARKEIEQDVELLAHHNNAPAVDVNNNNNNEDMMLIEQKSTIPTRSKTAHKLPTPPPMAAAPDTVLMEKSGSTTSTEHEADSEAVAEAVHEIENTLESSVDAEAIVEAAIEAEAENEHTREAALEGTIQAIARAEAMTNAGVWSQAELEGTAYCNADEEEEHHAHQAAASKDQEVTVTPNGVNLQEQLKGMSTDAIKQFLENMEKAAFVETAAEADAEGEAEADAEGEADADADAEAEAETHAEAEAHAEVSAEAEAQAEAHAETHIVNTLSAHANPSDNEIKSFVPGVATPLHSAEFNNKKNARKVHPKLNEIKTAAHKKPVASGYSAPMPALIERSSLAVGAGHRAAVVSEGEEEGASQFDHASVQLGPSHDAYGFHPMTTNEFLTTPSAPHITLAQINQQYQPTPTAWRPPPPVPTASMVVGMGGLVPNVQGYVPFSPVPLMTPPTPPVGVSFIQMPAVVQQQPQVVQQQQQQPQQHARQPEEHYQFFPTL